MKWKATFPNWKVKTRYCASQAQSLLPLSLHQQIRSRRLPLALQTIYKSLSTVSWPWCLNSMKRKRETFLAIPLLCFVHPQDAPKGTLQAPPTPALNHATVTSRQAYLCSTWDTSHSYLASCCPIYTYSFWIDRNRFPPERCCWQHLGQLRTNTSTEVEAPFCNSSGSLHFRAPQKPL